MESAQANSVEHVKQPDGLTIQLRINKKGKTKQLELRTQRGLLGTKEFFKTSPEDIVFHHIWEEGNRICGNILASTSMNI